MRSLANILLPFALLAWATSDSPAQPTFALQWGTLGSGQVEFIHPSGLATGACGAIYVVDAGNDRIQKFSMDGAWLGEWGGQGEDAGEFDSPGGIEVVAGHCDTVYVVDSFNQRVQKFLGDGTFVTTWGAFGTGPGQFRIPEHIAVDRWGYVYVTDSQFERVQKFTSDGEYVLEWGDFGTAPGYFDYPTGIDIDDTSHVYVADFNNARIQVFDSTGTYLRGWGTGGTAPGQLSGPRGVAIDTAAELVYVTESFNDRVQVFTLAGQFVAVVGTSGACPGEFDSPADVGIGASGNSVFVSDTFNHRVQKFMYTTTEVTDSGPRLRLSLSAYPNPFNPGTTIGYSVSSPGDVNLAIFDSRGALVRSLRTGFAPAGEHELSWNGLSDAGAELASGVYFVRLEAGGQTRTRKLVLLK